MTTPAPPGSDPVKQPFPWGNLGLLSLTAVTLGLLLGVLHVWWFSAVALPSWTDTGTVAGVDWKAALGNGALHAVLGGLPAATISCVLAYSRGRTGNLMRLRDAAAGPGLVALVALPLFALYGPWLSALGWVVICFCAGTFALWLVSRLLRPQRRRR